jgi:hypothetical protein
LLENSGTLGLASVANALCTLNDETSRARLYRAKTHQRQNHHSGAEQEQRLDVHDTTSLVLSCSDRAEISARPSGVFREVENNNPV